MHALTDGRDVSERSALTWITPLEAELAALPDAAIASGGGRMRITMDRYEADWAMVQRGWNAHVRGVARPFLSATAAIEAMYAEDPKTNDQLLDAFVVVDGAGVPRGTIRDGDAVVLFNFRGDRAIEISRAFVGEVPFNRGKPPSVTFAGMMLYDGDTQLPPRYLVEPPAIGNTVGEQLVRAGLRTFAVSETQKFGHVTYFFNGNRSGRLSDALEVYEEVPSDNVSFDEKPAMKCAEIVAAAIAAVKSGSFDHVRLNLANGDMVGHTGNFAATVQAMEAVDACVGALADACRDARAILLVTADHGNADEMYELDKKGAPLVAADGRRKPRTSHSLNPVPFLFVDPTGATLNRLEARVAELLGKEAALFVPSGTQANQLAIRCLTEPGDEVLMEASAHPFLYEAGGPAVISGVTLRLIPGDRGVLHPDDVRRAVRPPNVHHTVPKLLSCENTANRGGGTVTSVDRCRALGDVARAAGLHTHLDGARLWNAHAATGDELSAFAAPFDIVNVCFSKGLGAPVGSVLTGPAALMPKARRVRKMLGGGMRQAGLLGAACLYALDHHLPRLADDHARALALWEGLVAALSARGVRAIALANDQARLVTHLDVDDAGIAYAVGVFRALAGER